MKSGQKIAIGGGIAAAIIIAVVISSANIFVHNVSTSIIQNNITSVTTQNSVSSTSSKIQIVAAENFWGSLISQLGGTHVQVLSIVTDPNADPHEYESNTADAQSITDAKYVIVNGAGYDDWAIKIIGAGNNQNQKVLNVAALLGKKAGDNPHFWYDPIYVNQTVARMYTDLISIDPSNTAYYTQQYANLNASLGKYNTRINEIKQQFAGTRVAATEDIFAYLSNATGLDLVSPPEFMEAVAEGNDPPAQSVVQFQQLLQGQGGNVTVLVYNAQTVTPLTENIKTLAAQKGIPIVAVTETIQPSDVSFQDWMNAELISLQNALNAKALGQ
ncbi:MAG TPA: zinc ABC transporter substrate-binding protein [Candidatus Nitrosotalea sp.]|nr:zinc ABC transporter substrate-binding protein [Candidatus Nitrosotalea sp.]